MLLPNSESDRKSEDDYQHRKQTSDRAARLIVERFALSRDHALEVCRLAGIGQQEALR